MPPVVRSNTDYAFIMVQTQRRSKEALADEFLSLLDRQVAFKLMDQLAKGHDIMLVDNSENSTDLAEVVHSAHAKDPGPFLLGCKEYWEGTNPKGDNKSLNKMAGAR